MGANCKFLCFWWCQLDYKSGFKFIWPSHLTIQNDLKLRPQRIVGPFDSLVEVLLRSQGVPCLRVLTPNIIPNSVLPCFRGTYQLPCSQMVIGHTMLSEGPIILSWCPQRFLSKMLSDMSPCFQRLPESTQRSLSFSQRVLDSCTMLSGSLYNRRVLNHEKSYSHKGSHKGLCSHKGLSTMLLRGPWHTYNYKMLLGPCQAHKMSLLWS